MIRPISAAATRPLRAEVLRPGQPPDALVYPGDDHPDALHVGAFDLGPDGTERLVGIATVHPEPPPAAHRGVIPEDAYVYGAAFRLRGMATRPEVRGAGHGRALLDACFERVRNRGATYLWCNARLVALAFYERMGLVPVGDQFEIEGIGPHYVMWRAM
jgi:GNAT superfamily N-acetyltransferase